jgi:hypothetical protein
MGARTLCRRAARTREPMEAADATRDRLREGAVSRVLASAFDVAMALVQRDTGICRVHRDSGRHCGLSRRRALEAGFAGDLRSLHEYGGNLRSGFVGSRIRAPPKG